VFELSPAQINEASRPDAGVISVDEAIEKALETKKSKQRRLPRFTLARNSRYITPMRRHRWLLVMAVATAGLFLASCATSQESATPAQHKMYGTNSPGY
jgi:hypothetical protein